MRNKIPYDRRVQDWVNYMFEPVTPEEFIQEAPNLYEYDCTEQPFKIKRVVPCNLYRPKPVAEPLDEDAMLLLLQEQALRVFYKCSDRKAGIAFVGCDADTNELDRIWGDYIAKL